VSALMLDFMRAADLVTLIDFNSSAFSRMQDPVAQISNLLYRRLPVGKGSTKPTPCRSQWRTPTARRPYHLRKFAGALQLS